VVEEVMMTVQPRAQEFAVSLFNDVPLDLTLTADRGRFEQILLNLIDNAVKFNRRGGNVRVLAARQNGAIALSVKDTGIGIPATDLPRVFERFYRVDKGRSMELGGTGLGLAIVKHLVRVHGGHITVESKLGEGTCFNIVWPEATVPEPVEEVV
jgi:two-component system phosphate regulon sensor histidine kinase PhoR